jgi:hypothetical protein
MRSLSKVSLITVATAVLFAASVTPASADIVVSFGVNNQDTDNVLLNPAEDVTTVTGTVGQNDLIVEFTSSSGSGLLNADPSGQATTSGGTGNEDFTEITFGLDTGTFTRAVFNLNSNTNGEILIHVEGVNIDGGFFEDTFSVDMNGQNFFTVDAINGQAITTISLEGIGDVTFEDLRQVRLGGGEIQDIPEVPEPASMVLLGSGLAAVVAARRRRRTVKQ